MSSGWWFYENEKNSSINVNTHDYHTINTRIYVGRYF